MIWFVLFVLALLWAYWYFCVDDWTDEYLDELEKELGHEQEKEKGQAPR